MTAALPCEVLIVDDDPDVRDSLRDAIESSGPFAVLTAENGRHALDLLEGGAHPDVILLDLSMPVMDGRAFHAALRQRAVPSRVIVVSATAARDDPALEGVTAFVRKPVRLDQLISLVETHC